VYLKESQAGRPDSWVSGLKIFRQPQPGLQLKLVIADNANDHWIIRN